MGRQRDPRPEFTQTTRPFVSRLFLLALLLGLATACAIDPVPTPADRADVSNGGVQTSEDAAVNLEDDILSPSGGCKCTDQDGNEYWCEGDDSDASCSCGATDAGACDDTTEGCELVEPCPDSAEACEVEVVDEAISEIAD